MISGITAVLSPALGVRIIYYTVNVSLCRASLSMLDSICISLFNFYVFVFVISGSSNSIGSKYSFAFENSTIFFSGPSKS